jgi:hypothetical protein
MMHSKSIFLLLILSTTLFGVSCTKDPCEAVVCQNNGICIDGDCNCPLGFEGDLCETFTREKILGNFDVASNCMVGSADTDEWGIGASASAFNEVLINNFHKPALNIIATIVDPTTLEIKEQVVGGSPTSYTISGSGTIKSDGQLTFQYTVFSDLPVDTARCSVSAIRQE